MGMGFHATITMSQICNPFELRSLCSGRLLNALDSCKQRFMCLLVASALKACVPKRQQQQQKRTTQQGRSNRGRRTTDKEPKQLLTKRGSSAVARAQSAVNKLWPKSRLEAKQHMTKQTK